jgi:hypothetical protein
VMSNHPSAGGSHVSLKKKAIVSILTFQITMHTFHLLSHHHASVFPAS